MDVKRYRKLVLPLLVSVVGLALLFCLQVPLSSLAQGGIVVDKQLGRASPVVYVGEYITFTIYIRNDTTFVVDVLPLVDNFNTDVLVYRDASIPPDSVAGGQIDWYDLTSAIGDLGPGEDVTIVVGFIAAHPAPAVVNEAAVHDALDSEGNVVGGDEDADESESIGGSAPVTKTLVDQSGMVVTFTIEVWNNGYTTMTQVMLEDNYDPRGLAFSYSVPPPDGWWLSSGTLQWFDLTTYFGHIPPHGVVTVTTVFTTIGAIDATALNSAHIVAAGDWFGNDVDGGADDVPITIVDRPTSTPAPTPAPTRRPQQQPTATPFESVTVTPAPTITPIIPLLPETGQFFAADGLIWLAFALAGAMVLGLLWKHREA